MIYLDNSTTTRPSERSISRMMPFLTDRWGIPTAPHQKGQELQSALLESYQALYELVGAEDGDTVVFTSSGTEAINQVIASTYRDVTLSTGKNQFLTSAIADAPAIMAINHIEQLGCVGKTIEVNQQGIVTAEALSEALSPRTALVSLPWANGLTGVIQPLAEISDLCQQRGVLLHLDATHVLGKLFYELGDIGADFITFNGDQLHAPKGTGALYVKQGIKCSPLLFGGVDQGGLRAGPVNMPGLAAFSAAAKELLDNRDFICTEIARLRDRLEIGIRQGFPEAFALFQNQDRLPNCTAITFPGVINESLLFLLNRKGICASIGGGEFQQLSLILSTCQFNPQIAHGAVSFSLSRYTTEEEIERAIQLIVESAQQLRRLSSQLYTSETSLTK